MQVDKYGLPILTTRKEKFAMFLSGIGCGLVMFGPPALLVAWKSGALEGLWIF